ncbi:4-hydroxy-tetrahydrodipicolinate synthase [Ramlibacter tataouinensis]|uniref:4-hydroxy-tetrahydrodipicolinate synthase n=1 Tax=Ramlibacter tataouinensis (strain ATCC BAA-407 / DSM 14655 / LMG 21543 / TTB310) TaxID=365046 RepID=F5XXL5_RAMTT|nr:4-hydroxy-tetrahydrodipicolinate synthase [Ramlibacter tataouinensis]AEG91818.1 Candidate dihydrodipicolinate synthase [Ramlibacter tataouinensis TTB310]
MNATAGNAAQPRHFGAVLTAMVTPFDAQGRLDLGAAQRLARWLAGRGHDALVVAGTTGEGSSLTDEEHSDLVRAVAQAVTIPVLAGTGSGDTARSVALTRRAQGLGAAGVLVVAPYYTRPPQAGLEAHLRAVAGATRLPVMAYDVPLRTGRRIAREVLLRLFREVPNLVAFKDATGDPAAAADLVAQAGAHFDLYAGDDALTLPLLAVGGVGLVGTSTHWTSPVFKELIEAFGRGDVQRARELNQRLLPSFAFASGEDWVFAMSAKAMLRTLGLEVGDCRLPLPPAPPQLAVQARQVWQQLNG